MKKLLWLLAFFFALLPSFAHAANSFVKICSVLAADGVTVLDDTDCDHVADISDNCPRTQNGDCAERIFNCDINADAQLSDAELAGGNQADGDTDGEGDACDDRDGDTIFDAADNCVDQANTNQLDSDDDGIGDVCDEPQSGGTDNTPQPGDKDGDGVQDSLDNCSAVSNQSQQDGDQDGRGNACDNCAFLFNPEQTDDNLNGIGDLCERGAVSQTSSGGTSGGNSGGAGGPGMRGDIWAGHEFMSGSGGRSCQQSLNPQTSPQGEYEALIFLALLAVWRGRLLKRSQV